MDIVEFFQQSAGKWSSLRTSHNLAVKQQEGGRSDVVIEMLDKTDPDVVKLCEFYKVDPSTALCGTRVTWNGTMEWDQEKHTGSTVLVPLSNAENLHEGQLLRDTRAARTSDGITTRPCLPRTRVASITTVCHVSLRDATLARAIGTENRPLSMRADRLG